MVQADNSHETTPDRRPEASLPPKVERLRSGKPLTLLADRPSVLSKGETAARYGGLCGDVIAVINAGGSEFAVVDFRHQVKSGTTIVKISNRPDSPDGLAIDVRRTPLLLISRSFDGKSEAGSKGIWGQDPITIGRDHLADRFDADYSPFVSRKHFSISYDRANDSVSITDHASANGTEVTYVPSLM